MSVLQCVAALLTVFLFFDCSRICSKRRARSCASGMSVLQCVAGHLSVFLLSIVLGAVPKDEQVRVLQSDNLDTV